MGPSAHLYLAGDTVAKTQLRKSTVMLSHSCSNVFLLLPFLNVIKDLKALSLATHPSTEPLPFPPFSSLP